MNPAAEVGMVEALPAPAHQYQCNGEGAPVPAQQPPYAQLADVLNELTFQFRRAVLINERRYSGNLNR